jgi:hypothetical protein
MTVKKRVSRIVGLTAEVVKNTEALSREPVPPLTTAPDDIARLWSREYGHAIRSAFSHAEVREIVAEAKRKAWPHLNEDAVRLGSTRQFAERASALGADFRITKMSWPSGLAVFGFYLGSDSGLNNRPLICLNGAHHKAAVATAFLHEVGHHVTAELFSTRNETVQLSKQTGYEGHLSDVRELAADVLVSLGMYPRNIAAKLFEPAPAPRKMLASADERTESPAAAKAVLATARRYGLDLDTLSVQKKLQYQAGLVHYTRLRQALLDEYGM